MMKAGKPVNVGDHIEYVICEKEGAKSAAERAFHPDDVERSEGELKVRGVVGVTWRGDAFFVQRISSRPSSPYSNPPPHTHNHTQVDVEWYLTQQILPPIARLCEPIEGTSLAILAERLGLDKRSVFCALCLSFAIYITHTYIHRACV